MVQWASNSFCESRESIGLVLIKIFKEEADQLLVRESLNEPVVPTDEKWLKAKRDVTCKRCDNAAQVHQ